MMRVGSWFSMASACLWFAVLATAVPVTQERAAQVPTFTKDVAPILYKNCAGCHRPGEIAPMSLLTYEDARPWAAAIRDRVSNGAMPPWHADPTYGKFVNERRLSAEEMSTIVRWVNSGARKGELSDLPPVPRHTDGWTIGEPDTVLSLPVEYEVPAEGVLEYQFFEVPTNFTEDRWIQAMEIRPGNRRVVHHVLVYAREPNPTPRTRVLKTREDHAPLPRPPDGTPRPARRTGPLLASMAPGIGTTTFQPGTGMLIKAGSILTFQMHYTTDGTVAKDRTSIGFTFSTEPPTTEIRAASFINGRFVIPAGAKNHPVESEVTFLEDVTIHRILPHTHLRGKSWEYRLVYPDGRSEIVLSVPRYDFNWQTDYVFATPLKAPKGSTLKALAHYDNSTDNPANPDATAVVQWGDQTWEEMQYTGINYSIDGGQKPPSSSGVRGQGSGTRPN